MQGGSFMQKYFVVLLTFLVMCSSIQAKHMDGVTFTSPRKVLALYQLMKDVHELFEAKKISYWIDSGTLLGAVRHKGIIPWDTDLDLCIDKHDEERLLDLKPLLGKLGLTLVSKTFGWTIKAKGGFCDIFLVSKRKGTYIYADKPTSTYFAKRDDGPIYYTQDELFPLKQYPFGDLVVWGPQDPYPYLDNYYKGWRTTAKFLESHRTYSYSPKTVVLTEDDTVPAQPLGPLENRVSKIVK